ncbi:MAG: FGGY-family carbohydrate kinase [bacterium]|nr:FGGY-family carbohydrate kinase [bacterium]
MKNYLLAIDQGTSGLKLMLAHLDGQHQVSLSADYPTHYPAPGSIEQDPQDWWRAVCSGIPALLEKAGIAASDIAAIGVDGVSWMPVMVGKNGETLGRCALWNDTRSTQECEDICRLVGEERVMATSGNPVQPYYATPKLLWYRRHEPERFQHLDRVVTSNGYLGWKLTGCFAQDASQAYGWAFYSMEHGTWDEQMAEALGIDLNWLPPLCESMQVIGAVTARAAQESGLAQGTPVIAGGLDAACGVLGAGVVNPGPAQEQSGSAGGMSICTDRYQPAPGLILGRHVVPGRWLVQGGTVGGGGVFRWISQQLYPDGSQASGAQRTEELTRIASGIPAGSEGVLFLPYMAGERSPIWNPNAKGVYYGLDFSKTRAHLVRAALEGTAYSLKHNLDHAAQCGAIPTELRAVGGASASALWMQIKADVTGYPIRAVANADATAIGCLMLAGVGSGVIRSFDEACRRFVALQPPYLPNEHNTETYANGFTQYKTLYTQLKGMMKGQAEHE